MRVLITDANYPGIDALERPVLEGAGFEVDVAQCRSAEQVIQAGRGASALLTQHAPITKEVFQALQQVRIVSRFGVGVDNIDLGAAHERGVWVANVPDYCTEEVAAHALAMALSLTRHLALYDRRVREGDWHHRSTGSLRRPNRMTLGVVGHGRIGSTIAQMAQRCFEQVLACDPYLPSSAWPSNVQPVDHETLFAQSQVVTLHVPLTEETENMVDQRLLKLMPPGSYLINTSRGRVVNLDDLLQALDTGRLDAAGLDVLPQEPPPGDHPILSHPRVLLSPHSAFYSVEAEEEVRRKAALNIVGWRQRGHPRYIVVEGRRELDRGKE